MRYLWINLLMVTALHGASRPAAQVQAVNGKASAPVNAELKAGDKFSTGGHSKSQVGLGKGFFRVGSDTGVQVVTSNHLSLEKGIMLAGSNPSRFWRPTVTVNAPGYKMQVRGTAQIAYYPGHYVKITVLEGKVQVALQSLTGEFETLEPGQMLIINPSDKRLPEPVEVDIGRLAATSQLTGGGLGTLSTQALINASAAAQGAGVIDGSLAATPFQMQGASPELSLAEVTRDAVNPTTVERSVFQANNDLVNPNAVVRRASYANGVSQPSFTGQVNRTGQETQARANVWTVIMDGGSRSSPAVLSGTITADPAMFAGTGRQLSFVAAGSPLKTLPSTKVTSPTGVALQVTGQGLNVDHATMTAGSGTRPGETLGLATTGTSNLAVTSSTLSGYQVNVNGSTTGKPTVTLDNSTVIGQQGATIGLRSVASSITIQNSTQLKALVGSLDVLANGGSISISGAGTGLTAGKTLTIDALGDGTGGTGTSGLVQITDAQLIAPTIRIRSYGASGDTMIIDGSQFNATQLIELFAGGTSTLRFKNHVALNADTVRLSAYNVTVDPGGTVRISGAGTVYGTQLQFNGGGNVAPGYGSISAGRGLTIMPYNKTPHF